MDVRAFDCSSASCPTVVSIKTRPPILSMDDVRVMTDPKKIQERKDKFKSDEKKEPRFMDPFKALKTMHTYLKNLLGGEKRNIPKSHELFLLALGAEGGDIMRKAHFMVWQMDNRFGWCLLTLYRKAPLVSMKAGFPLQSRIKTLTSTGTLKK